MTSSPRLRRGALRDLPILVQQRRQMFLAMGEVDVVRLDAQDRDYARFLRVHLRDRTLIPFLVVVGKAGVVSGGAIWLREQQPRPGFAGGRVPYLMSMYTEPAYRGQGLATLIIRHAIDWCRGRHLRGISLHASDQGAPLYHRLGWTPTREHWLSLTAVATP